MARTITPLLIPAALVLLIAFQGGAQERRPRAAAGQQKKTHGIDTSRTRASYANFSRVTGTPEEMIIDFGLNAKPTGTPTEAIVIDQRVILSFYTAKRLLAALKLGIDRHEQVFGPIETDVRKRVLKPT